MKAKNRLGKILSLLSVLICPFLLEAQTITTIAGGLGNGGTTAVAQLNMPASLGIDAAGNIYIADRDNNCVRKISTGGINTIIAGTGERGHSGDGGPGSAAKINAADYIAVDAAGNVYLSETDSARVRKISTSGIITTYAGTGVAGWSGDGGAATLAKISTPQGLCVDGAGNLFIVMSGDQRVRKVDASGIITTIAGIGSPGSGGDGSAATLANLNFPEAVAVDRAGNVYIADKNNYKIRKINTSGIISTFAGTGTAGFTGDGTPATSARIDDPWSVRVDTATGKVYITDGVNFRIRRVDASGIITTVAGNGSGTYGGDGGPATAAGFGAYDCIVDGSGNLLIADAYSNRIRKVNSSTNIISTIVGPGNYGGDGGQASAATLFSPAATASDGSGNLYIADMKNNCVRKINTAGIISTIVGTGSAGYGGDGGMASSATLNNPMAVAVDRSGNVYVSDMMNHAIRKVDISTGLIKTIGGTGTAGYGGDGGMATSARLNMPNGIRVDTGGNVYVADMNNNRIRKIDASGNISTLVGDGTASYGGDGGMASSASLNKPTGVALDTYGNLYLSDSTNHRIRMVDASGIITTIAGNGSAGYGGDGGMASSASLSAPAGVTVDIENNIFIADLGNNCIRKVSMSGIISTVAGNHGLAYGGDGGMATSAGLSAMRVSVDNSGNMYIADGAHNRIRMVHYGLTGIPNTQVKAAQTVRVFPMPASNTINMDMPGQWTVCTYRIIDVSGKIVLEGNASHASGNKAIVDVSALHNGNYQLSLAADGVAYSAPLQVLKE